MQFSQLIIHLLNGLSYGLLLFLMASGLSLIFGFMGIINLAHGSYYMLGAYTGIAVYGATGSFILSLIASGLVVSICGILIERFFISNLYKRELDQVLLTFGFSYIFMDICKWLWGGTPRSLPTPSMLKGSIYIAGDAFPVYRLGLILIGLITAVALNIYMSKTRTGMIIRAGVDDKEMVTGMGLNIKMYFTVVFALGAMLAGFGGVFGGPVVGAYPGCDSDILVLTLAVVVIGGLGTLKGAFWGSILIGFVETFGKIIFPDFSIVTIYVSMVLILIFRPRGLFGKEGAR